MTTTMMTDDYDSTPTPPVVVTPIKEVISLTDTSTIDIDIDDNHDKNIITDHTVTVNDDKSDNLPVSVATTTSSSTSSPPPSPELVNKGQEDEVQVVTNTATKSLLYEDFVEISEESTKVLEVTVSPAPSTTGKKRPATLSSNSSRSISNTTGGSTSSNSRSRDNTFSPPSKHVKHYNAPTSSATNAIAKKPSLTVTTTTTSLPVQQAPVPSPSAVAKNWKQQSTVQAELAALKQRGLAKLLNQHFTTTAQQLAIEKAAVDAAILDLQERKARTSTFTPTNNLSEMSPLDQACIQANKWRAECRRKERETLLLYQQYVHKFGPTTILPVPTVTPSTNATTSKSGTANKFIPTAPPKAPPAALPIDRPTPTLVPTMTAQIEQTLDEYCARGAVAHPSIMTHGIDQTYSSIATKEEIAFREYYRKQLEAKGADVICSPGFHKGDGTAIDAYTPRDLPQENDGVDWNNNDVCSMVSGLTTLHSAMTREFIFDCEQSVATFLRDEQATVRKMLEEENDASSSENTHVSNVLIVQDSDATAKAAENMVQQMQDILQEYQKKHNDTTSATNANDATALTEMNNKIYPRSYPTNNPNEIWMVYYDELYHQEYYHETTTNRTQWDPPGSKKKGIGTDDRDIMIDQSYSNSHSTDAYSVMNGSNDMLYDDFEYDRMDRILENNPNRVMAYRKRQRRKRRRRRIMATIIISFTLFLIGSGTYYLNCLHNSSGNNDNSVVKPAFCNAIDDKVMEQWKYVINMISDNNEDTCSSEPIVEEVPVALEAPLQCILQLEDEIYIRYYLQSIAQSFDKEEMIRRPWGCNIPLAYLFHSKCRRMATLKPIFDLQALINSMLQ